MGTRLLALSLALCVFFAPYAVAKKKPPTQPITQIRPDRTNCSIPGIGPVTAQKSLQMRKSYGAFKSVNELMAIRGIGPKRLEKMRMYLTVGKPKPAHPAVPAKCSGCSTEKSRSPVKSTAGQKTQTSSAPPEQSAAETEEP